MALAIQFNQMICSHQFVTIETIATMTACNSINACQWFARATNKVEANQRNGRQITCWGV